MRRLSLWCLSGACLVFVLSGCMVRHYTVIKERVDQDLSSGNRGYIQGNIPSQGEDNRLKTRKTHTLEIELASPFKIKQMPEVDETKKKDARMETNIDSLSQNSVASIDESDLGATEQVTAVVEEYTVQKGDTLQKISSKFYGTSKKWNKIYEANKDTLKSPDRVYPGRKLNIPKE